MKYYKQTENRTLHILMEVLEEEAKKNPLWTLQGLFALCRDVSLLDDVPENADYFDEIYLTFAELFSEFNRYGRLEDVPETIGKVCSFTTDGFPGISFNGALGRNIGRLFCLKEYKNTPGRLYK